MCIRRILTLLTLSVLPLGMNVQAAQKVMIQSELASPVVMENAQDKNYLKVSLVGYPLEIRKRSPINLALVIDRSTSMSGDRIEKARDAAIMAVNMLGSDDTLSVVAYDSGVEVIVPATRVKDKQKLIEKIRRNIHPRGMTALFAGVSKGLDQVSRHLDREQVNRIILLSDGQANVGPTSVSELAELARVAAKKGVAISTMGIGKDYNEDLMTAIAGYSDGNHAFVENVADLEKTFVKEFNDVMSVVAQDVEVVIRVAGGATPVRLLGRDGEIRGNTVTVKLNQLYSNQEKYVLLEVVPAKGEHDQTKPLADIDVSYNNLGTGKKESYREQLAVRYSGSAAEVKQAVVEDVLVDSAIQEMALENERAIMLMDEGKVSEAKDVMDKSAEKLKALPASAPAAQQKIQRNVDMSSSLRQKMEDADQSTVRKALKEQKYNMQQNNAAP